jgi:hypothetical protein
VHSSAGTEISVPVELLLRGVAPGREDADLVARPVMP